MKMYCVSQKSGPWRMICPSKKIWRLLYLGPKWFKCQMPQLLDTTCQMVCSFKDSHVVMTSNVNFDELFCNLCNCFKCGQSTTHQKHYRNSHAWRVTFFFFFLFCFVLFFFCFVLFLFLFLFIYVFIFCLNAFYIALHFSRPTVFGTSLKCVFDV